eukprot:12010194-Ditylum_brightwellii.AAC.1
MVVPENVAVSVPEMPAEMRLRLAVMVDEPASEVEPVAADILERYLEEDLLLQMVMGQEQFEEGDALEQLVEVEEAAVTCMGQRVPQEKLPYRVCFLVLVLAGYWDRSWCSDLCWGWGRRGLSAQCRKKISSFLVLPDNWDGREEISGQSGTYQLKDTVQVESSLGEVPMGLGSVSYTHLTLPTN